jgi:hypothetical protein
MHVAYLRLLICLCMFGSMRAYINTHIHTYVHTYMPYKIWERERYKANLMENAFI